MPVSIDFPALSSQLASMTARTNTASAELDTLIAEDNTPAFDWLTPTAAISRAVCIYTAVAIYLLVLALGLAATASLRAGHIARDLWDRYELTAWCITEFGELMAIHDEFVTNAVTIARGLATDAPAIALSFAEFCLTLITFCGVGAVRSYQFATVCAEIGFITDDA